MIGRERTASPAGHDPAARSVPECSRSARLGPQLGPQLRLERGPGADHGSGHDSGPQSVAPPFRGQSERMDPTQPPPRAGAQARAWLATAVEEARAGLAEGGIPIGAALYGPDGSLLGRGHNRRVQDGDPSTHAETAAFRAAGRQRTYRGTTMVTTLSPCWYCSGLVRQFGISRVVVGEATTFHGGHDWLAEHGVEVLVLDDPECVALMRDFIRREPALWNEDIGDIDE